MGGSGPDRTDDFQKLCGSGLDRIQFYRIRTGLGLKNFTVRSSLVHTNQIWARIRTGQDWSQFWPDRTAIFF